ncbi:MAG: ABC transporter ATP-binding protein [Thermodesulfobacteriota bacterium]
MAELLRTERLRKYYGVVSAAADIDLGFQEGVLTSIIGPNGAGKSTFINLLTGSVRPDRGRILFMEEDITRLPTHARVQRGISRSFQIGDIFPRLTVKENLQIPVLARKGRGMVFLRDADREVEIQERVHSLLEEVGLEDKANLTASSLSHGDQRLLEIALALAPEPRLLFLDEPTAGMNPVERVRILEQIRRLSEGRRMTFVIVEHDMDIVFALSDRIVVLHRGAVIADGRPNEIRDDPQVREIYLGEEFL